MKRIKLTAIMVAALTVLSVCGCSTQSGNVITAPATDEVKDVTENVVEEVVKDVVEDVVEDTANDATEDVTADDANTEETSGSNAEYPSQLYSVDIYCN